MIFEITSTIDKTLDRVTLLPRPEYGMRAKVESGRSTIGERLYVVFGQWCRIGGVKVSDDWIEDQG